MMFLPEREWVESLVYVREVLFFLELYLLTAGLLGNDRSVGFVMMFYFVNMATGMAYGAST